MSHFPGLAGMHHVGITVPDIDSATEFFVRVFGAKVLFDVGPYISDDDWMTEHLGVHPRAVIRTLRMIRIENGPSLELFDYEAPEQDAHRPKNSDHGGHHVAFYVKDMDRAVAHLKAHGVEMMGEPSYIDEGPFKGLTWLYFLAPWGLQMEVVSTPNGLGYEADTDERMWTPMTAG